MSTNAEISNGCCHKARCLFLMPPMSKIAYIDVTIPYIKVTILYIKVMFLHQCNNTLHQSNNTIHRSNVQEKYLRISRNVQIYYTRRIPKMLTNPALSNEASRNTRCLVLNNKMSRIERYLPKYFVSHRLRGLRGT